jgi:hypothetical protein
VPYPTLYNTRESLDSLASRIKPIDIAERKRHLVSTASTRIVPLFAYAGITGR